MRKGDRQRIPHRRPDRDRGKGVVAARAIQVAKPQTRIAELPFSAAKPRASRPQPWNSLQRQTPRWREGDSNCRSRLFTTTCYEHRPVPLLPGPGLGPPLPSVHAGSSTDRSLSKPRSVRNGTGQAAYPRTCRSYLPRRATPCSELAQQRHNIIPNRVALVCEESVSVVTGGITPAQAAEPTHAHLHH
jgi:hypothetical protein